MRHYVNPASGMSLGSREYPFHTLQEAAMVAQPGDEVIVAPGVYRENVDPPRGGTEEARIVYRAEIPGSAVLTGAEVLKEWAWKEGCWQARVPNTVFQGDNPYADPVDGDWCYNEDLYPVHRGQLFADDAPLMEVQEMETLRNPPEWMRRASPAGCFHARVQEDGTVFSVCLFRGKPGAMTMEYTVRRTQCHLDKNNGKRTGTKENRN